MATLTFKVDGMVSRCSFTCQSCSDPVRDTLEALPGIGQVEYDPEKDLFILEYDAAKLKVPDILAAVTLKGMELGRQYRPRVVV